MPTAAIHHIIISSPSEPTMTGESDASTLCSRCSVLVFHDWPRISEVGYEAELRTVKSGRVGRSFPVEFELEDTFPGFPVLKEGVEKGCEFCKTLKLFLEKDVGKRLLRELDGGAKGVEVSVERLRYFYDQTYVKEDKDRKEGIRNALERLTGYTRVAWTAQDGVEKKEQWSFEFTICAYDDDPVTDYLQIDGRPSEKSSFSPVNVERMQRWIKECEETHEQCKQDKDVFVPTRLLDVDGTLEDDIRLCITKQDPTLHQFGDRQVRYAALSYCWGDTFNFPALKTFKENLDEYARGISLQSLPQTIRDAVTVTRVLGMRWLWIDALCIVQNDNSDWQREAALMMHVYGHAIITIAAAFGSHSHSGFFPQHTCAPSTMIPFCAANDPSIRGRYLIEAEDRQAYGSRADISYHNDVDIREWNSRAWTYQERALSLRTLFFGNNMRFECQQVHLSSVTRDPRYTSMYLRGSSVHGLKHQVKSAEHTYNFWIHAVEAYSGRKLTYETDRLVAISGIAHKVADCGGERYIAGLWQEDLLKGLLWAAFRFDEKRREYVAPSWSWASTSQHVQYIRTAGSDEVVDACKVLDVQTIVTGGDEMGAVSGGFVSISGQVKEFRNVAHFREECGKGTFPTLDSIAKHIGETQAIFALPLLHFSDVRNGFRQIQGLLLCKAHSDTESGERSEYVRLGLFLMDKTSGDDIHKFDACPAQDVTIV
ncbi:hypothetical protein N0V90_011199 [Kalmusia sp. IMI 367209]|nr:hypothetical protein N0V90_011199 [Kalmusia sp. IMI 367209]